MARHRRTPAAAREQVAALAARLVADDRAATVREAVGMAVDRLHAAPSALPSEGLVRRHLQPRLMQRLGAEGYASMIARREELAETVMTIMAGLPGVVDVVLAGRAARGQLDGDVTLHLRVYTRRAIGELAQALLDVGAALGWGEPRFSTADTRLGRRDRVEFDAEGATVSLIRCMPEERAEAQRDLFTGRRIATHRRAAL